jgi:hypothetical protein
MDEVSVPVRIDDVRRGRPTRIVRCSYLRIECSSPAPDWTLTLGQRHIPFLLVDLVGVIRQPVGGAPEFVTAQDIEETYDAIEASGCLEVTVSDLWLPPAVFSAFSLRRGTTLRVGERLFRAAWDYRHDRMTRTRFWHLANRLHDDVAFSEQEDAAFRDWRYAQVEHAKRAYSHGSALKWVPTDAKGFRLGGRHR